LNAFGNHDANDPFRYLDALGRIPNDISSPFDANDSGRCQVASRLGKLPLGKVRVVFPHQNYSWVRCTQLIFVSCFFFSYTQEIPTRFKKDIVNAAALQQPVVNATGLQHVLHNIGADHVMSVSEIQAIFREMGNEKGEISAQHMVQLL
jgi:hypothetical protein